MTEFIHLTGAEKHKKLLETLCTVKVKPGTVWSEGERELCCSWS